MCTIESQIAPRYAGILYKRPQCTTQPDLFPVISYLGKIRSRIHYADSSVAPLGSKPSPFIPDIISASISLFVSSPIASFDCELTICVTSSSNCPCSWFDSGSCSSSSSASSVPRMLLPTSSSSTEPDKMLSSSPFSYSLSSIESREI